MIVFDNKTPASFILYRRQVEHRDGAVFVADQAFNLTNSSDRYLVRQLLNKAEELEAEQPPPDPKLKPVRKPVRWHEKIQPGWDHRPQLAESIERAFPPPQPSHYETPFARAIHREYEEDHLAHYLREHMEAARLRK